MGKKRRIAMGLLFVFLVGMLAGCGEKEYVVEYGIDGYVYLSRRLSVMEDVKDLRVIGDYLYYMQDLDNKSVVGRVSVAALAAGEGGLDFSQKETLAQVRSITFELPEGAGEGGKEIDFISALNGGMKQSSVVDLEKRYGSLSPESYAVAPDGTLYFYMSASAGEFFARESAGGVLCRQNQEGEWAYQVYLPELLDFAVDAEGRGMILTQEGIQVLDQDGNQTGFVSTEAYHMDDKKAQENLFTDSEGRVYYSIRNANYIRTTYEIAREGNFQLKPAGKLLGDGLSNYSAAPSGNVFLFAPNSEGILYLYDREADVRRALLNWYESGLMSSGVLSVTGVTPDILLVSYNGFWGGKSGIYQLKKTPVEELPERELIVIAAPSSTFELQRAVMLFNAESPLYRIVLASYGAEFSDAEGWVCPQLDASLASSNPPDILDLSTLNIVKYAKKNVLEDLTPYMEGGSLDKDDIPDNLREGLTFDGKLVTIPVSFYIYSIVARASQMEDFDSWTMEDVYRLSEQHPEKIGKLIDNDYGEWEQRDWLLQEFCARYYLEKFVDWEKWECSFDSDEFRSLIEWVEMYGWEPGYVEEQVGAVFPKDDYFTEDVLMVPQRYLTFTTLAEREIQFKDAVCLKGYPSVDGKGYYPARIYGGLGINVNSAHKEAAWEFIEYYLQINWEEASMFGSLPISKTKIRKRYEYLTELEYVEGAVTMDGEPATKMKGTISVASEIKHYDFIEQDQADAILNAVETADFRPMSEEEEMIVRIVLEEAESYYRGDKSLEEVTGLIQNRVQLLLNERKQ